MYYYNNNVNFYPSVATYGGQFYTYPNPSQIPANKKACACEQLYYFLAGRLGVPTDLERRIAYGKHYNHPFVDLYLTRMVFRVGGFCQLLYDRD